MTVKYKHLNDYYKALFGERVLKIPVDGGFSCPNRDGKKGYGGCVFCSSRGAGDRLLQASVPEQIKRFFASFKAKKANKFIVYFQNFSNTYKSLAELKETYDSALIDERIVGLDIATRCDCINEDIAKLLSSYKSKYYVQVELGLQTASEKSHTLLNQEITNHEFQNAVTILNRYNIDVVIHVMVGLPGETHEDIIKTVEFLNSLGYQGIKIHSTFVEEGTLLHKLYVDGKYQPISYEEYMEELVYILTHINKDVIVHRVTGDPYLKTFVAPEWMTHKKRVINHIDKILEERGLFQGCLHL